MDHWSLGKSPDHQHFAVPSSWIAESIEKAPEPKPADAKQRCAYVVCRGEQTFKIGTIDEIYADAEKLASSINKTAEVYFLSARFVPETTVRREVVS